MRFTSSIVFFLGYWLSLSSLQAQQRPQEYIAPNLTGENLLQYIFQEYSVSNPLGYNGARDQMYSSIDKVNGQIIGVYTGYTITSNNRTDAFNKGINTEHVWPQGLFDKNEPMRGDIHHIFPTRIEANSARSNYPFDEIPDNQTDKWFYLSNESNGIPSSNIDLYSELDNGRAFEPREDFKGNVARAIFYFWSVYQNRAVVKDDVSFFNGMKDVLYDWHKHDPVDEMEWNRSLGAEQVQGNKNPFVHDSTLVDRVYFGGKVVTNEYTIQQEFSQGQKKIRLLQNYPNPFNPSTTISFELTSPEYIRLSVYTMLGQPVAMLAEGRREAGWYRIAFNADQLPSGIYFYRLEQLSGEVLFTRRMTLIK
ncbi:MAG: endonuclease [Bacteroidota bacterium]|nr:endonuclease [Bacteroidota bacterium]